MNSIKLVTPDSRHKDTFLEGLAELTEPEDIEMWVYTDDQEDIDLVRSDFEAHVKRLRERGSNPPKPLVPDSVFWAMKDETMVGRISFRHELNDFLRDFGGHVGYITRPSFRRQGIATEMLRLVLQTEPAKRAGKVLVTCGEDNPASEGTILKNGGELEGVFDMTHLGRTPRKRFWIDLGRT